MQTLKKIFLFCVALFQVAAAEADLDQDTMSINHEFDSSDDEQGEEVDLTPFKVDW